MYADHISLLFCLGAVLWVLTSERSIAARAMPFLIVGAALFVPFGTYTGLEIAVAAVGSMSVTSIILAALLILSTFYPLAASRSEIAFGQSIVIAAGVLLYPSTFGFTWFDAYSFGSENRLFVILAVAALTIATFCQWRYVPIIVTAVTVAYSQKLLPSANWFDYAIDPLLWIAMIVAPGVGRFFLTSSEKCG